MEKDNSTKQVTKNSKKDFSSFAPKTLDPDSLEHYRTIDSLLTQTPEIRYSEKLDEIIVSGLLRRDDSYQIKTFDGKKLTIKGNIEAHHMPIHRMILLPEELLATVSADNSVKIWRLIGLTLAHEFKLKYEPFDVCVNHEQMAVVIVGKSATISCYGIKTGSHIADISTPHAEGYNFCVFLPDKNAVVASQFNSNIVSVIDYKTSAVLSTLDGGKDLNATIGLQLVENNQVAIGHIHGINVWDLSEPNAPKKQFEFTNPVTKLSYFCIIPEEDTFILAEKSPIIQFFKYSTKTLLKSKVTKLQTCCGITQAKATDRLFVVDSIEGMVEVFARKERVANKAGCGCYMF